MACKNCEELRESKERLRRELEAQDALTAAHAERADELQEACNRYKGQLNASQKEVESLWLALKDEMKKAPAHALLRVASEAAQIASLHAKMRPGGSPITDEASSVALAALKQVRERLEEGAKDAGTGQEG